MGIRGQDSFLKGEREQGQSSRAVLSLPGLNTGVSRKEYA